MDQEKGSPAAVQELPYHSTLIPGTRAERLTAAIRRFGETLFGRYTVIKAALFFRCDLSRLYEWYRRPAPDGVGSSFRPRAPPHRVPDRRRVTRRGR